MITLIRILPFILLCGLITPACRRGGRERQLSPGEFREQRQLVERANRYLVQQDRELIESYVKRRNWDMTRTESGLYYQIHEHGDGPRAVLGKYALMHYRVSLLDGTPCYSTMEAGPVKSRIGRDQRESGLVQGLLLMREGDKARFIIPPHMAHGLLGDEGSIPPRSVIVYEVELLEVSDG